PASVKRLIEATAPHILIGTDLSGLLSRPVRVHDVHERDLDVVLDRASHLAVVGNRPLLPGLLRPVRHFISKPVIVVNAIHFTSSSVSSGALSSAIRTSTGCSVENSL